MLSPFFPFWYREFRKRAWTAQKSFDFAQLFQDVDPERLGYFSMNRLTQDMFVRTQQATS